MHSPNFTGSSVFRRPCPPFDCRLPDHNIAAIQACCRLYMAHCEGSGQRRFFEIVCSFNRREPRDTTRSVPTSSQSAGVPCWTGFAWLRMIRGGRTIESGAIVMAKDHTYSTSHHTDCSGATGSCLLLCFLPRFVRGDFSLFLLRCLNRSDK